MVAKPFAIVLIIAGALFFAASCFHSDKKETSDSLPDVVSYNFNIRPILSDKCFKCHGPDANKRQAHLRLDIPEIAFRALKDNPNSHALVPGEPDLSEVYRRITTSDSADM